VILLLAKQKDNKAETDSAFRIISVSTVLIFSGIMLFSLNEI